MLPSVSTVLLALQQSYGSSQPLLLRALQHQLREVEVSARCRLSRPPAGLRLLRLACFDTKFSGDPKVRVYAHDSSWPFTSLLQAVVLGLETTSLQRQCVESLDRLLRALERYVCYRCLVDLIIVGLSRQ